MSLEKTQDQLKTELKNAIDNFFGLVAQHNHVMGEHYNAALVQNSVDFNPEDYWNPEKWYIDKSSLRMWAYKFTQNKAFNWASVPNCDIALEPLQNAAVDSIKQAISAFGEGAEGNKAFYLLYDEAVKGCGAVEHHMDLDISQYFYQQAYAQPANVAEQDVGQQDVGLVAQTADNSDNVDLA